jgi:molybdopterin synthase catalytic subunit
LGDDVLGLRLEHYPGMTEKALYDIAEQAASRWSLQNITIIHRVGDLDLGEQIVLVMTCSPHRDEGYEANRFIMDFLKSKAPFWKKERIKQGERWIEQRESDVQAVKKW